MQGIIDRFEEQQVVIELEDGTMNVIHRKRLPIEAKEGDVVDLGEIITINVKKTEERRRHIEEITKNIWE